MVKPCSHNSRSVCALANGLELLGDKWTLLIIRDLMFTNRNEFGHFLHSGEGISTNILTERLERLQQYQIVEKLPHPSHGKKSIYQLTEQGIELFPALIELILWSFNHISDTFIPPSIHKEIVNNRAALFAKVKKGEALVVLDL